MPAYRLSQEADQDLADIYAFGFLTFGEHQADLYGMSLIGQFERLAEFPLSGIARPDLNDGLRSSVSASHVIYYVPDAMGCLIVRILHHSQDPLRHL